MLAFFGAYVICYYVWYSTSDLRYNFKLKYILKPKFKKGDYAIVPDGNDNPTIVQIETVSLDWKMKTIEYTVYPMRFPDKYIDYDYFEQLCFLEKRLTKIENYYESIWKKEYTITASEEPNEDS